MVTESRFNKKKPAKKPTKKGKIAKMVKGKSSKGFPKKNKK